MNILITGGAGYIGSHAVLAFRKAGHTVVVLDNLSTGSRALLPADVPFVQGDAGDHEQTRRLLRELRINAVVHFAASISVPESVEKPLIYYGNNSGASRRLIEACVAESVERFIFSSTAAVYGKPEQLPVSETAPTRPESPYGHSKLMTEQMLSDVSAAHGLRFVALRYFNVAGADPEVRCGHITPNSTNLLKAACETALGRRPVLDIFGADYDTPDGSCIRDFIHVSDLADAHVAALDYLEGDGRSRIFNCGYGRGYSVKQVIAAVESETGKLLPVRLAPRRPGDVVAIVADSQAILQACNWTPHHDNLRFIVRTALAWEEHWISTMRRRQQSG